MAGGSLILDQSLSSSGFALWDEGKVVSGSFQLCDGIARRALGYRTLWGFLDNMHKDHGLAEIVHEEPALGAVNQGSQQIGAAMGLVAVMELFACSRGLPEPVSYPPQSWRASWFTKAERKALRKKDWKRPAIERARQFGFDPLTSDEAEAIAILDHHLIKRGIASPWRDRIAIVDVADLLTGIAAEPVA